MFTQQQHQFGFDIEHSEPIFTALIGSKLMAVDSLQSDTDLLTVCSHKVQLNPGIEYSTPDNITSVTYDNTMREQINVVAVNVLSAILNPQDLTTRPISTIIHHLAAIKKQEVEVFDERKFATYNNFLKVPGNGSNFWNTACIKLNNSWMSMPTNDVNWSQKYDGSELQKKLKTNFQRLVGTEMHPKVDSKVGYDIKFVTWLLIDFILASYILSNETPEHSIIQTIKDIKNSKTSLEDLQKFKNKVYKQFRNLVQSPLSTYALGEGYNINETKKLNLFGLKGYVNVLDAMHENS